MELVCPAGNLPSLKTAIREGADSVYMGFRDATNARHFAGLNFADGTAREGVEFAHRMGRKVFVAINTYPQPSGWRRWREAVDRAANLGVDALIIADVGVLDYASQEWPDLALHLSVQGSATHPDAISFHHDSFGIRRVVLPRVLSLKQVERVAANSPVPVEVFGFGSLCVMVEGRCFLSSYVTGKSPNTYGACSPASAVSWAEDNGVLETRLNEVLVDRYAPGEPASYPTICKGRFRVRNHVSYAIEQPNSLNSLSIFPRLFDIGVAAIKIEGRQRSPAYVGKVTRVMREALDQCAADRSKYKPQQRWEDELASVSEGTQTTLGAYDREWQ